MKQIIFNVTKCPRGGKARSIKCAICDASVMEQIRDKVTGQRRLIGYCRETKRPRGIRPARR